MAIRGRPERPHLSELVDAQVQGLDEGREIEAGLRLVVEVVPYIEAGLGFVAVDSSIVEAGLGFVAAEQHVVECGLALEAIESDSGTVTLDSVGLKLVVIGRSGYAGAPRVRTAASVSVGQEVQRRGQIIPSVD